MSETDERIQRQLYIVGWICMAAFAAFFAVAKQTDYRIFGYLPECMFHRVTGLYCPGCGGTRALLLLLRGEIARSFCYHPVLLYAVCVGGWFMISQTIWRLSGGRIRIAMRFREIYLWIALALTVVNCLIKNLAPVLWHVDLLVVL